MGCSFGIAVSCSSCGDTGYEALEDLGEAIEAHFSAPEEVSELNRVLQERGISIVGGNSANRL